MDKLDQILEELKKKQNGASIHELLSLNSLNLSRRTLQRRLKELVEKGVVITKGKGAGLRYHAKKQPPSQLPEGYIDLTTEAKEIRSAVSLPLTERNPIGYNRDFLESYQPNQTRYLPENIRLELKKIGQQPNGKKPAGTFAKNIFNRLLIDLSWNSSRLEGNTYSLLETERLLAHGEAAEGKSAVEGQMIMNHKTAIEFIIDSAETISFNRYSILNLHALLSDNLLGNPQACGRLRSIAVGIGGTPYEPVDIPHVIEECFSLILDKAQAIDDPFEQAFFMMVHLPYLQPFEDVNKRVSRLAANLPFIKKNLCPLSFVDLPESLYIDAMLGIYELNRIELLRDAFVWAYRRSALRYSAIRHEVGEPDRFYMRHREAIQKLIKHVVDQSMDRKSTTRFLQQWARENIETNEQRKFVEVIETELLSLHGGNIARFKISPEAFEAWQRVWS